MEPNCRSPASEQTLYRFGHHAPWLDFNMYINVLSKTNYCIVLNSFTLFLSCLVSSRITIEQGLVYSMSGYCYSVGYHIIVLVACCIHQWGSAIWSPWVCSVTSRYLFLHHFKCCSHVRCCSDIKPQYMNTQVSQLFVSLLLFYVLTTTKVISWQGYKHCTWMTSTLHTRSLHCLQHLFQFNQQTLILSSILFLRKKCPYLQFASVFALHLIQWERHMPAPFTASCCAFNVTLGE